jgi:hypothetical protein
MTATPLAIRPRPRVAESRQSKATRAAHSIEPAVWLLSLDERRFAHQVGHDVRGLLRPETAAALRDPRVLARWVAGLRGLIERIDADLQDPDRREMPHFEEWRAAARGFRRYAHARLDEALVLLVETEVNAQLEES